MLEKLDLAGN